MKSAVSFISESLNHVAHSENKATSPPARRPRCINSFSNNSEDLQLPDLIPHKDKELVRLLRAARHAQRYPATDTKRGRPGKWKREELLRVAAHLGNVLNRETSAQVSFASFVDHYLRLPDFPSDVLKVLENGDINLFEAEQFARVTSERLGV